MAKMKIFSTSEKNAYESPPVFNSVERKRFFALPIIFNELMSGLKNPTNKICFLVTAGYFKAQHRFFARQFHQMDIEFVANQIGVNINEFQLSTYSKVTYLRHQGLILHYFGFSPFDLTAKGFAEDEVSRMVKVQIRPKLILLEIIQLITRKKIALPSYNKLTSLIIKAINHHQHALNKIIKLNLNKSQKENLDDLLKQVTGSGSNSKWRYQITLLKKPSQSSRPSKIKENVNYFNDLLAFYLGIKPVANLLKLSHECLRYYAYSVIKSQIHQVSRRSIEGQYLHLIAFIVYQTFKLQDILIDTLLLSVQATINATDKDHKDVYYQEREERNQSVTNLVGVIQKEFLDTISMIKAIIADVKLTADQKVAAINLALNTPESKQSKIEQSIKSFNSDMTSLQQGKDYYTTLEEHSLKLQNRVADIVRKTIFDVNCGRPFLLEAILHYQTKLGNIDKNAPISFLSAEQRIVIIDQDGKFRVSLYKALLYLAVADAIRSGVLNVVHSEKYRSLDDYMIPKCDWDMHKDEYLKRAELTKYSDCQATLESLNKALNISYQETNNNFIAGENAFLKFRADGTFHVSTPKLDEIDALSLGGIFPEKKYIPLLEVLATVDHFTGFLEEFEHWQMKHQPQKPPKKVFFAGIMAYGCDIGPWKLAQTSKQINANELDNTLNWYFSLANVQDANDRVLQFMDEMDLPNTYRLQDNILHTSSDGQKVIVTVDSLNANYSFKYLGKDKGVSIISFIDMRQMMWHSTVISSSEREAAYVIDGLMRNDVIKSDIHSTDTHGYSEVIFAVTYLLGFTFAPRIKGLGHQQLYAFSDHKNKTEIQAQGLQPDKYIKEEIIHGQWDEILRFIATIKLKITTASQLFRRLNSYSKQHPLYKALKEFGKPPKTLFILKYVDDPPFRQSIEKQLNKVEGSHKLSKAVSLGNDHEFLQGEKEEQDIAEGCRRLIKNSIICWNYLYLSKEIEEEKDEEQKNRLIEAARNGSLMRWGHFNFNGEYDFSDEKMVDSIGLRGSKKPTSKGE
jgi:TnpA family transposase